jgi:hypothetical protein
MSHLMKRYLLLLFPLFLLGAGPQVKMNPAGVAVKISSLRKGLVLDAPMISNYKQSATIVSDLTAEGGRNTGVLTGTPPTIGADGVVLDGNDYVGFDPIDISGGGTISIWFKATDTSGSETLYAMTSGTNNRNGAFLVGDQVGGAFYDGATRDGLTCTFAAGVWNHLLVTRTGVTAQSYLNNVACNTAGAGVGAATVNFLVGRNTGGSPLFLNATVRKTQVWLRVLSAGERTLAYTSGPEGDIVQVDP